jgi:vancomycin permeability regulator SanA
LKYTNQGLTWHDFHLRHPGNIINAAFTAALIIGLIWLFIRNHGEFLRRDKFFQWIALTGIAALAAGKVLSLAALSSSHYVLGEPLHKVSIGAMYIFYMLLLIFQTVFIWQIDFHFGKFLVAKALLNSVLILGGLFVFIYLSGYLRPSAPAVQKDKVYDTGVVMGAAVWSNNKPSPLFVHRINKALDLYRAGTIKTIYLTGSNAPGEVNESEAAFEYLKSKSIVLNDVFLERQTTSTTEQIRFVKKLSASDSRFKQPAVISDVVHAKRIVEIIKFYNLNFDVIAAEMSKDFTRSMPYKFRETAALLIFWLFGL